ncbi:MAG: leucine-rich repeat domain-containing protein, partial [Clostridia bacterium]|nr:leucine-rich repeat domain-containing protein [Clostridia bacterium]
FYCVTELGKRAFKNSGIRSFSSEVSEIKEETFADSKIETLSLSKAVSFGDKAFYNCAYLKNYKFPTTLENIGNNCFEYSAIQAADLSATKVTQMGECAFAECYKLEKVNISSGLKNLPARSFKNDSNITDIDLGVNLKCICSEAFYNCYDLNKIIVPNSVERLEKNALDGISCEVSLPFIGSKVDDRFNGWNYVFGEHSYVNKITITRAKSVWGVTFRGANSLRSVDLKSVEKIENLAFYGLEKLESITLSNNLKSIGKKAFAYCSNLNSLKIPDSVTYLGNTFAAHSGIKDVKLPSAITAIPARAFEGCYYLVIIYVPDTVTQIGRNAIESWMSIK